jgi:nucleotide-binding universal stress UspA family protein
VVVGVSGSLGSLTALARAAAEARRRGAELWPVLAWEPPGGELSARRTTAAAVLAEDWERLAGERLRTALSDVLGSPDLQLPGQALLAREAPGPALVRIADREDDLLVVGAGGRGRLRRALWPSVSRYCIARARCPVLAVPPSPLQPTLAAVRRRNAWGLRLDTGCFEREIDTVQRHRPSPRS